jgi:hypothetical protein
LYRNPQSRESIEGPFKLATFAKWVSDGVLSAEAAAALPVWRRGATEAEAAPLGGLLLAAAATAQHGA